MKYGDIPEEHKELMDDLQEMETWLTANLTTIPLERAAQGFVCIAHDWFDLECEEDGERLLKLVEAVRPNYFMEVMPRHMMEDKYYALLVNQLLEKMGKTLESIQQGEKA